MLQQSEDGKAFLQHAERLELEAYPDPPGQTKIWSIGYGHRSRQGERITAAQADRYYAEDVGKVVAALNAAIHVPTTQPQFDALVSLAYNVGIGDDGTKPGISDPDDSGVLGSTLLRKHNAGDWLGAADEFPKWRNAGGKPSPVLEARRKLERGIYLTPNVPLLSPGGTMPSVSVPAPAMAGGAGMLFFCPYCSRECVARCSVERAGDS